jgi:hypothetical protein
MSEISLKKLTAYRSRTFRYSPGQQITSKEEAIQFVNQRGFIFFWPIKDILLPSLWAAAAGDRPVADAHDDPGHVTWGWKDSLLGARRWYYAKVLRKRATIISLETTPYFYALSNNFGSPEEDYLIEYLQGHMTQEAKAVYEALLQEGPLDFKILPVGISQAGGWRYAFIYDLVPRHFPDLIEQARHIQESEARQKLILVYLASVGAARIADLSKLFRWHSTQLLNTIDALVETGRVIRGLHDAEQSGEWIAIPEVL